MLVGSRRRSDYLSSFAVLLADRSGCPRRVESHLVLHLVELLLLLCGERCDDAIEPAFKAGSALKRWELLGSFGFPCRTPDRLLLRLPEPGVSSLQAVRVAFASRPSCCSAAGVLRLRRRSAFALRFCVSWRRRPAIVRLELRRRPRLRLLQIPSFARVLLHPSGVLE